jgi:hypothetical protein
MFPRLYANKLALLALFKLSILNIQITPFAWLASYKEEYDGLKEFDSFEELTFAEYRKLAETHGPAIPSMYVLVTKKDEHGNPVRTKSRIVVLGNKDPHQWTKGECFAPVVTQAAVRLLVSLTIEHNKFAQQGDCKNAFCNPVLPDDKIIIVRPPQGCPFSKPNALWRLHKTQCVMETPQHTLWTTPITQTLV